MKNCTLLSSAEFFHLLKLRILLASHLYQNHQVRMNLAISPCRSLETLGMLCHLGKLDPRLLADRRLALLHVDPTG